MSKFSLDEEPIGKRFVQVTISGRPKTVAKARRKARAKYHGWKVASDKLDDHKHGSIAVIMFRRKD